MRTADDSRCATNGCYLHSFPPLPHHHHTHKKKRNITTLLPTNCSAYYAIVLSFCLTCPSSVLPPSSPLPRCRSRKMRPCLRTRSRRKWWRGGGTCGWSHPSHTQQHHQMWQCLLSPSIAVLCRIVRRATRAASTHRSKELHVPFLCGAAAYAVVLAVGRSYALSLFFSPQPPPSTHTHKQLGDGPGGAVSRSHSAEGSPLHALKSQHRGG